MKFSRNIQWLAATVALTLLPATAMAQPFDHLKCYRVKDTAKFSAEVDLLAFQTQFNVDPLCKVKGKAKIFCVPVEKSVINLTYPSGSPLGPINMPGQDLQDDRLCYRVKCPVAAPIAPEEVQDQFGKRIISSFKSQWLCTNAIKTNFQTTTTTTTTSTTTTTMPSCSPQGGMCAGSCPNPGEICTTSGVSCGCVMPCQFDPATAMCGGQCPAGLICDIDPLGVCGCL